MNWKQRSFVVVLVLLFLAIAGGLGYFAYESPRRPPRMSGKSLA